MPGGVYFIAKKSQKNGQNGKIARNGNKQGRLRIKQHSGNIGIEERRITLTNG